MSGLHLVRIGTAALEGYSQSRPDDRPSLVAFAALARAFVLLSTPLRDLFLSVGFGTLPGIL